MSIGAVVGPRDRLATATPTTPLSEIGRAMREEAAESIVVVDGDEPVGIVSDRELALHLSLRSVDRDAPAADVMTRDVVTIDADASLSDACGAMKRNEVRRLPVVEDGRLVGVVGCEELFTRIEADLFDLADVVRPEARPH